VRADTLKPMILISGVEDPSGKRPAIEHTNSHSRPDLLLIIAPRYSCIHWMLLVADLSFFARPVFSLKTLFLKGGFLRFVICSNAF